MSYTFEEGFDDIADCFARYHGMGVRETKEYFKRIGLVPILKEYYAGLAYEPNLEMIRILRREIAKLDQPLPEQIYFTAVYDTDVPAIP